MNLDAIMSQWTRDVEIQTTKVLTTTGGTVWTAARRLSEYLEHEQAAAGLLRPGVRVLELGAGCGLLGLLVARNCPGAAEVCLTEQAFGGALAHLQRNVELNRALPNMGCVTTAACDWGHFMQAARTTSCPQEQQQQQLTQLEQQQQQQQQPDQQAGPSPAELSDLARLLQTPWDVIIGSDLIYNREGAHALPRVLAALLQHPSSSSNRAAAAADPPHRHGTGRSGISTSSSALVNGACHCLDAAAADSTSGSHPREQQPLGQAAAAAAEVPQPEAGSSPPGWTPCCYYCHTKHRFDALDVEFLEQLEAQGLAVEEVVEAGEQLPPPSPPPFSSLFPDMRVAVFRITRAQQQQQQQQDGGARRDAAG